jgi:large subunit ribosomal protein L4
MKINSFTSNGVKQASDLSIPKDIIEDNIKNHDLIGFVYHSNLNNQRENLAITKTRGLVRGGGRKPWRQKGTGRARFGSSRNPIWRSGGIVFGPTGNENYTNKVNAKTKLRALKLTFNICLNDSKICVIEDLKLKDSKTKELDQLIFKITKSRKKTLLVLHETDQKVQLSARNLSYLKTINDRYLSVNKLLDNDHLIFTADSFKALVAKLQGAANV